MRYRYALSAEYIVKNRSSITSKVVDVPESVDNAVAQMKLASWNKQIDVLTPEQHKYLFGE